MYIFTLIQIIINVAGFWMYLKGLLHCNIVKDAQEQNETLIIDLNPASYESPNTSHCAQHPSNHLHGSCSNQDETRANVRFNRQMINVPVLSRSNKEAPSSYQEHIHQPHIPMSNAPAEIVMEANNCRPTAVTDLVKHLVDVVEKLAKRIDDIEKKIN